MHRALDDRRAADDRHAAEVRAPQRRRWVPLSIVGAIAVVGVLAGVLPRLRAHAELQKDAAFLSVPAVSVIHPSVASSEREIVLPASMKGFLDAPIFARTSGYLGHYHFDIGARVKKGQLLAEIETPEVDQQLRQGRAELATAKANLRLSKITAERYAGLLKEQAVAKQDADNAAGDLAAKTSLVRSAEANLERLAELQSFQKVYAPFDGVITARNTDVGALIDPGGAGGTRAELFHIAQTDKVRVYVNVPEMYASAAKVGLPVDITVAESPNRHFQGSLVRSAGSIDAATRTLLVEVDVDNPDGALLPGAFAQVHLKLSNTAGSLRLPSSALLFRSEGLRVAIVGPDQRVVLTPISIGRDLGSEVEVASGLTGNEAIIADPPDSLLAGQTVRVVTPPAPEAPSAEH
jgi:RND family efflux transporter MFP subunit